MPYIDEADRGYIDVEMDRWEDGFHANRDAAPVLSVEDLGVMLRSVPSGKVKGAFNYFASRLFCHVFDTKNAGYTDLSDAIAVLGDMQHEMRRRLLDKYEDQCIEKNGDLEEFT